MNIVKQPEITVVGPFIKTSNKDGRGMRDIPALWGRYMKEDWASKIPNRSEAGTIYAVYFDYTDTTAGKQDYTMIIGEAVTRVDELPEGLASVTLPTQNYVKVEAAGKLYEAVPNAWYKIWSPDFDYSRTNIADYEVYDARAGNPEDGIVDIFVGIEN